MKLKIQPLSICFILIVFISCLMTTNGLSQNGRSSEDLASQVQQEYAYLFDLYTYLHRHPELSFHEEQTAARIASELQKAGFDVTPNVGGHGLVGVLQNGDGATVMVRTDLDALPVTEKTGLEYASQVRTSDDQGNEVDVMHACGHDMHMTVFTGTARMLSRLKDKWSGTVVMIGQPAEERGAGAKAMLSDGLFTRFPRPDYALAFHVKSDLPTGQIGYCAGYALANVDAVDITVRGVGGHGSAPHTTKDPVVLSAQIILALQTIVSREINPLEPAVVTVGSIHGGTKHNIISDEVHMQLTLRSYSNEVRTQTIAAIERICRGLAQAAGLPENLMPIVTVQDEFTPATYNDPDLTRRVADVFRSVIGAENVIETAPVMGGEDFGLYGRVEPTIPISMFWLGTIDAESVENSKKSGEPLPSLHSSKFAPIPETTIRTGVQAMTAAVLNLLAKQ